MATHSVTLPPKLYFRIGEVAELVGVQPHVLRYWEREFRTIRPTKSAKGQRVYSRRDVENLMRVRDLLYRERFTIAGAKQRLGRHDPTAPSEEAGAPGAEVEDQRAHPPHDESDDPGDPSPATACAEAGTANLSKTHATMRDDLLAIRADIQAFLAELDPPRTR